MHILVENIRQLIIDKQEILLEKLNFGACDASIDAFKSRVNLELPAIFYDFYCQFNGCASNSTLVWKNMTLMPLSAILNEKIRLDKNNKQSDANAWNSCYLPFLSDSANSMICIDMSGGFDRQTGQIIQWNHHDSKVEILFESFEKWLEAWFRLLQKFDKDIIANREEFIDFCEQNIINAARYLNSEYPKLIDLSIQ